MVGPRIIDLSETQDEIEAPEPTLSPDASFESGEGGDSPSIGSPSVVSGSGESGSQYDEYPNSDALVEILAGTLESSEGETIADLLSGINKSLAELKDHVATQTKVLYGLAKSLKAIAEK